MRPQLGDLEALIGDGGEDEEMKAMAREERAALLEEVCVSGGGWVGGRGGGGAFRVCLRFCVSWSVCIAVELAREQCA